MYEFQRYLIQSDQWEDSIQYWFSTGCYFVSSFTFHFYFSVQEVEAYLVLQVQIDLHVIS